MYELFSAGAGIGLYFVGRRVSIVVPTLIVGIPLIVALLVLAIGARIGASRPRLGAYAGFGWSAFLAAVGTGLSAGALAATAYVIAGRGNYPSPTVETVASATVAVIGLAVAKYVKVAERFGVPWATKVILGIRYGNQFAVGSPIGVAGDNPSLLAYRAIHNDQFSAPRESVDGWSTRARRRRLELIREAIMERKAPGSSENHTKLTSKV